MQISANKRKLRGALSILLFNIHKDEFIELSTFNKKERKMNTRLMNNKISITYIQLFSQLEK